MIERPETEILVLSLFLMRLYAGVCIIYRVYVPCMSALLLFSFTITKLNTKMALKENKKLVTHIPGVPTVSSTQIFALCSN